MDTNPATQINAQFELVQKAQELTFEKRRSAFWSLRVLSEQAYWMEAVLLAVMDLNKDYDTAGFDSLTAYCSAPIDAGGLDTTFETYDALRMAIRNGYFYLACKEKGVKTELLIRAGRTKVDLIRKHLPENASVETTEDVLQAATAQSKGDTIKFLKDGDRPLDATKEPEPIIHKVIRFEVPGQPVPKARPRLGKGHVYTPEKTKKYEQVVKALALNRRQEIRLKPFQCAVSMQLGFYLKGEATGKPDLDNLVKSIKDALNGILYGDDAQVVHVDGRKFGPSDAPRAVIVVKEDVE